MEKPSCPHCRQPLTPFSLPDNTGWQTDFHVACFNDECPYYRNGWDWMEQRYGVKCSYRFRVDPATGKDSVPSITPAIVSAEVTVGEVSG